ncbi:MAG: glutamyl-tRNA reductase [Anaerolineae bacterium]|jgi:glutamyl-tRNA reductase
MQIIQLGLSHQTASVEIREQLALSETAVSEALRILCPDNGYGPGYALEGAILSTCNRLEVYALVECTDRGQRDIRDYLAQVTETPRAVFEPYLQVRQGETAITHLCKVACGLDSLVLGESQIQGQVAEAYQLAQAHGAAGPVTNVLFRTALRAGKRARTETAINQYATSISHVAVELALQIFDELAAKTALLVGAGEMAELAAKNLVDNGVGNLLVVNRSKGRAAGLARQYGGEALGWDRLTRALWRSDIVISSTAAPHAILRRETVATAMRMRRNRPLFLIDIAVPRDVDPAVSKLTNVFLYDIDDLQQVLEANLVQRRREIPHVQVIVQEEVAGFLGWLRAREVVPTIVDLRQHVDGIREAELAWAMNKLEGLSDRQRNIVLAFSQRLVNKILHRPTIRLKQHANDQMAYRYTEALRDLFGIIEDRECGSQKGGARD